MQTLSLLPWRHLELSLVRIPMIVRIVFKAFKRILTSLSGLRNAKYRPWRSMHKLDAVQRTRIDYHVVSLIDTIRNDDCLVDSLEYHCRKERQSVWWRACFIVMGNVLLLWYSLHLITRIQFARPLSIIHTSMFNNALLGSIWLMFMVTWCRLWLTKPIPCPFMTMRSQTTKKY